MRAALRTRATPVVISGNLGPRGDGYRPDSRITVIGGCCGTDHRHVEAMCDSCQPASTPRLA